MIKKPMLASSVKDIKSLKYPIMGSSKLDGIRCIIQNGRALSRSLKPIRNNYIRNILETSSLDNVDGELIIGNNIQETTSAVMTINGEPNFKYHIFDYLPNGNPEVPFIDRYKELQLLTRPFVEIVSNLTLYSPEEVIAFEEEMLIKGYEGIILRDPNAPYKFGRSSLKEGYLLKMKRFTDDEAVVVGFTELMRNENEIKINELGYSKRSSSKEGKVPADTLGALLLNKDGKVFECGTGFTQEQRKEIWDNKEKYIGQLAKFKYQEYGVKDLPRIPVFIGWRNREDLD